MAVRGRIRDLTIGLFLDPKGVKSGAKDAERALDGLADESERSFRRMSKAADKGAQDTKGSMADAGQEIGDEFMQNLGEGISSGQFDAARSLDTLFGTLGGVVPALGPTGVVFGLGLAAASLIANGISQGKEEVREAASELFEAMRAGQFDAGAQEALVMKALGVKDWAEAIRVMAQQASDLGVTIDEVFTSLASGKSTAALRNAMQAQGTSEMGWMGLGSMTEGQRAASNVASELDTAASIIAQANQRLAQEALRIAGNDYPWALPTPGGYDPFTNRRP